MIEIAPGKRCPPIVRSPDGLSMLRIATAEEIGWPNFTLQLMVSRGLFQKFEELSLVPATGAFGNPLAEAGFFEADLSFFKIGR